MLAFKDIDLSLHCADKSLNPTDPNCLCFSLQVEVDWEKINTKIDMELQKEAARPGAKPYNG